MPGCRGVINGVMGQLSGLMGASAADAPQDLVSRLEQLKVKNQS